MASFPCSGEVNFKVADAQAAIAHVLGQYATQNPTLDHTDGLSANFGDWRFNLRSSNTEPLLRLNVESRGSADLMGARLEKIRNISYVSDPTQTSGQDRVFILVMHTAAHFGTG